MRHIGSLCLVASAIALVLNFTGHVSAGLVAFGVALVLWLIDRMATHVRCEHCACRLLIRAGSPRPWLCSPCATQQRIMRAVESRAFEEDRR